MAVNVFMLSRDPRVTDSGSPTSQRLEAYRRAGAELRVVYFSVARFVSVLMRGLRMVRPGMVVTSQDPFEAGLCAWMIARLRGAALEVQLHGDFFGPYWKQEVWHRPFRLHVARWVVRHADQVRVMSRRQAVSIQHLVAADRILQMPVPSRVVTSGPVLRPTILFAGRFSSEKNLPLLVRAFHEVRQRFPTAALVLCGAGEEGARLAQLAQDMEKATGVGDSIQFTGWSDAFARIAASLCVLPSRHESWGRFAVEAALAGCPVVMTDVGCAGEVIVDGESGWVVPVDDAGALATALIDALARPDEAMRRATRAKEKAQSLPNGQVAALRMVAAWESLVTRR